MVGDTFKVLLRTTLAGMPRDLFIDTTAKSERVAVSNALHLLRKYGADVHRINRQAFKPSMLRFTQVMAERRADACLVLYSHELHTAEADPIWNRALDLRLFIPQRNL